MGVIQPRDLLTELGVGEGDEIMLSKDGPRSFSVKIPEAEFARQMALAEEIMEEYRDALAELAK